MGAARRQECGLKHHCGDYCSVAFSSPLVILLCLLETTALSMGQKIVLAKLHVFPG